METSEIYLDDTHLVEYVHEFRYHLESDLSASLSDHDCLRFLRAKEGNMSKAVEMAKVWNEWRHNLHPAINSVGLKYSANLILACESSDLLWNHPHSHLLPCGHHAFDKAGRPVFWLKLGLIISQFKEVKKYFTNDQLIHYIIWNQEALLLRQEFSAQQRLCRIADIVMVADMNYLPMSSFMDKDALSMMRFLVSTCQHHYPETLHKLLIVNTPWHFSAAFKLFSSLIRPRTLAKISIAEDSHECLALLGEHLNACDIPVYLGGTCTEDFWEAPSFATGAAEAQVIEHMRKKICPNIIDKVLWPEELAAWHLIQRYKLKEDCSLGLGHTLSGINVTPPLDLMRRRSESVAPSQSRGRRQRKSFGGRRRGSSVSSRERTSENELTGRHAKEVFMSPSTSSGSVGTRRNIGSVHGPGFVGARNARPSVDTPLQPSVLSNVKTRIISVEEMDGYHEYVIRVNFNDKYSWKIRKRYSDFVRLREKICEIDNTAGDHPRLPPKVVFGKMSKSVVARRQTALATFLVESLDKSTSEDSLYASMTEGLLLEFLGVEHPLSIEQRETTRSSLREERGEVGATGDLVGASDDDEGFEYASSRHSLSAFAFPVSSYQQTSASVEKSTTEKCWATAIVVVTILASSLVVHIYNNSLWLVCYEVELGEEFIMS